MNPTVIYILFACMPYVGCIDYQAYKTMEVCEEVNRFIAKKFADTFYSGVCVPMDVRYLKERSNE
jgi:hypothetical protein